MNQGNSSSSISNIAVFIDGDNISANHYQKIIDELKQMGRILTQRLYADFSRPTTTQWKEYIMNYGIDAIQTFRIAKKESTDNCLIVDCMRTLYHGTMIDMFVIVSSDSDFSSLASEIRMKGKFCIGVGYNHTPMKLRNNCDRFVVVETLINSKKDAKEMKDKNEMKDKKDEKKEEKKKELKSIDDYFVDNPKFVTIKKLSEICKIDHSRNDIIIKDDIVYWLMTANNLNIRDIIFKIIEDSNRSEVHMSWLKDKLLTIDSSFDQREWGFTKMIDFATMVVYKTGYIITKDKNDEFIIKLL
jgi:uncharacterized LabA/DUF88 family protein